MPLGDATRARNDVYRSACSCRLAYELKQRTVAGSSAVVCHAEKIHGGAGDRSQRHIAAPEMMFSVGEY